MRRLFAALAFLAPVLAFAGPVGSRPAGASAVDSSGTSTLPLTAPDFIATDGTTGFKLKMSSMWCASSDVSCSATAGANAKYNGTNWLFNGPTGKGFKWTVNGVDELTLSSAGALVATGAISGSNLAGTNTGDVTIGTANGLSLASQALSLAAATNSVPGALTAADHTTFAATSAANTADVTLGAFGSTPSANAASLASQVLTMQPADATHPGGVSTGTQTFGGNKTMPQLTLSGSGGYGLMFAGGAAWSDPADGTCYGQLIGTAVSYTGCATFGVSTSTTITGGSTKNKGTIVLAGGTGTATVTSGATCACNNKDAATPCQWSLSGTTLTITSGAGTDHASYLCF
jgi:hypothetical protein